MIIHGAAYSAALEEMIEPRAEALRRRLERWAPQLERVTEQALAEGDALCGRMAESTAEAT
ncbi:hypothetical protein D3C83_308510 [compost metagenome]